MKTKSRLVLGALVLLGPGLLGAAHHDPGGTGSSIDREAVAASLSELGIDGATRVDLLDRLEAGEVWDSLTGAHPIAVETEEIDGRLHVTRIYEDGSRSQTVTQLPRARPGMGISSATACTTPLGPYPYGWNFTNCRVDLNVALIRMNYYIDGRTRGNTSAYPPLVTRALNLDYQILGGSFVSESLTRPRPTGSLSLDAQARGRVVLNYPAQGGTVTISLYANVGSIIKATNS